MSLFDTIQSDMYAAMKSGDKHKTGTLRVALSTLKDKKIEKREDLTDVEAIKIIQNLVKQRKEAADIYKENGRNDLMENENAELVKAKYFNHFGCPSSNFKCVPRYVPIVSTAVAQACCNLVLICISINNPFISLTDQLSIKEMTELIVLSLIVRARAQILRVLLFE